MSIVPNFDYLLVMPSGNIIGFHDEETAKAYINNYYYFRTRNNDVVGAYEDLTEDFDDIANVLCYKIRVEEGECKLYNTRDIIEKIQEQEKLTKTIIDKIVDIKQDLLQNRDCANLIPKVENIEDICREMLK